MKEHFRKLELILDGISIVLTVNVNSSLVLVEMNEVETKRNENGIQVTVSEKEVTAMLDYEELDEVILLLQQASDTLKRAEQRECDWL